ncbi:hypothetical protein DICVIV_14051 [Dictyocaulus viviparus]|uniref:Uncharacterized protein n=1 Tax=Dictyocaulus viviparus TaxID=29172 RepID=A0A0D8XC36_DICVI|nr:hypothetical protein DICVIV_14051 [Dictyocaulus viviparus]
MTKSSISILDPSVSSLGDIIGVGMTEGGSGLTRIDIIQEVDFRNIYMDPEIAYDKEKDTTDENSKNIAEKSPIVKLKYDELDKIRWNDKI